MIRVNTVCVYTIVRTSFFILTILLAAVSFSQEVGKKIEKGEELWLAADYQHALPYFREAYSLGQGDQKFEALLGIIKCLIKTAAYQEANEFITGYAGRDNLENAKLLVEKSKVEFYLGNYKRTSQLSDSVFELLEGEEKGVLIIASALNQKAKTHVWQSEPKEADSINAVALEWYEKSEQDDYLLRGDISNIEALTKYLNGYYEDAIKSLEQAIEYKINVVSRIHPLISGLYSNIGVMHRRLLRHDQALTHFQYTLEIERETYGQNHPQLATTYTNLGVSYAAKGDFEGAKESHLKALEIRKQLGENHPKTLDTYEWLAEVYFELGESNLSRKYLNRVIEGRIENFGYFNNHVTYAMQTLGELALLEDELVEAHFHMSKAKEIAEEIHGSLNYDLADVYNGMGMILHAMGNIDSSIYYFHRGFEANTPGFSTEEVEITQINEYSFLNFDIGLETLIGLIDAHSDVNPSLAYELIGTGTEILKDYIWSMNSDADRIILAKTNKELNEKGLELSYQLYSETGDINFLEDMLAFSETSRGISLSASLSDARARQISNIPDEVIKKEAFFRSERERTRTELIQLDPEKDPTSVSQLKANLLDLKAEHEDFIRSLESQYSVYASLKYGNKPWNSSEIQETLKEGDALLEFFLSEDDQLYVVIITKQGFEAKSWKVSDIDKDVENFRNSMLERNMEQFHNASQSLYEKLALNVLEAVPSGVNRLIVIPDGALAHVPFELLNASDGAYLLEDYVVSYGISATLFFDYPLRMEPKNNEVKILAMSPNFPGGGENAKPVLMAMRSGEMNALVNLPGSKVEVSNIASIWSSSPMTDQEATETYFKEKGSDYDILHFATHGLVDQEYSDFSKMALTPDAENDGFVHAYELKNLSLKARLAVISACNTGYGRIEEGEGIMNLSRSFAYAGVPATVVSLWPASDKSTPELMEAFHQYLRKGFAKDEALNNARKDYLKQAVGPAKHPFFWGGFILIGNYEPLVSQSGFEYKWLLLGILLLVVVLTAALRFRKKQIPS